VEFQDGTDPVDGKMRRVAWLTIQREKDHETALN